jgi:hypothetical protein
MDGVKDGDRRGKVGLESPPSVGDRPHLSTKSRREILEDYFSTWVYIIYGPRDVYWILFLFILWLLRRGIVANHFHNRWVFCFTITARSH